MIHLIKAKQQIRNSSCGKRGCKLYVLPQAGTSEYFKKALEKSIRERNEEEHIIREI